MAKHRNAHFYGQKIFDENELMSICFIKLCWLTEAQTFEHFGEKTKGLIKL